MGLGVAQTKGERKIQQRNSYLEYTCERLQIRLLALFLQKTFLFLAKETLSFERDNTQTEIL
jgi:hypothetical protein